MTRRKTDFFLQLRLFGICMPKSYQVPLIGFEHKAVYTDALHVDYPSSWVFRSYPKGWTPEVRELIRKRDEHTCQLCGCVNETKENGYNDYSRPVLDVHHIDYNRNNLDEKNLITLCHSCHSKTNTKRTAWRLLFESKLTGGKNDRHVNDHVLRV